MITWLTFKMTTTLVQYNTVFEVSRVETLYKMCLLYLASKQNVPTRYSRHILFAWVQLSTSAGQSKKVLRFGLYPMDTRIIAVGTQEF